jgi:hypothetical protein
MREAAAWADEDEGEMSVLAATTTHCRRLSRAHCSDLELGARRLSLAENPKKENLNEGCERHWRVYGRGGEEEERKSEAQTPVRYAFCSEREDYALAHSRQKEVSRKRQ